MRSMISISVLFLLALSAPAASQVWEVGEQAPLTIADQDNLGVGSVLATGNLNCDIYPDLVGGAPLADNPGQGYVDSGVAQVRLGSAGGPLGSAAGYAGNTSNARAGAALAIGDFGGGGCEELVIGIPGADASGGDESGSIFVAGWDGDSLDFLFFIDANSGGVVGAGEPFDHFGEVLAVGDFDFDGFQDLAIGLPGENVEGTPTQLDAGAVTVLYGGPAGLLSGGSQEFDENDLAADAAQANAHFGAALAAGDFNGDDYGDLAIGIPDRDVNSGGVKENAGQVVVLYGTKDVGLVTAGHERFDDADFDGAIAAGDRFGAALAAADFDLSGACIAIDCYVDLAIGIPGEPNIPVTLTGVGGVVVAYGSSGLLGTADYQFLQQDNLPESVDGSEAGDAFGSILGVGEIDDHVGADLAVGVPNEKIGGLDEQGVVHLVFGGLSKLGSYPGQSVVAHAGFTSGPGAEGDRFGSAVAFADFNQNGHGDAVIGVPGRNIGAQNNGLAQLLYGAVFADGFDSGGMSLWSDTNP